MHEPCLERSADDTTALHYKKICQRRLEDKRSPLVNADNTILSLRMRQRRIQEGRYQHIVYAEWLPWHLGPAVMEEYDLWVRNTGRTSYDDTLDATLSTEFSSAHFRYSHTNVPAHTGGS
ncbi:hypothetical protein HPB50_019371 [Hyalomma asiaticum]|uniref:Uncharacterized protein n=1 Tax=Hyalomma asiaticum TaxID=266040 RepID=A0ACB7RIX5_HYAAI|nr:hypothetical protein HPB50_019371 [Hyalomma asiaticum]